MSDISLLAVIPNSAIATELQRYIKSYEPRFDLRIASSPAEALAAIQERHFDIVWYQYEKKGLGFAEVAMMVAPRDVIAVVKNSEGAVASLDEGAAAVANYDADSPPWPICVRLSEVSIGRQAQLRAIHLTEQRFEAAIRGAHLGLWHWSVAHRQMVLDERWRRLLGYAYGDEIKTDDTPWISLIPAEFADRTRELIHRCLTGAAEFFSLEAPVVGPNGDERWVLISGGVSHRTKRGEPIQMSGVLFDLQQRRGHQPDSAQPNSTASHQGAAPVGSIDQLLKEARTQLSTILGWGDMLLREEPVDPIRREAAHAILGSARGLLKTIQSASNAPAVRIPFD